MLIISDRESFNFNLDVLTESANSANIVSHDENESNHETLDRPSDNEYYSL